MLGAGRVAYRIGAAGIGIVGNWIMRRIMKIEMTEIAQLPTVAWELLHDTAVIVGDLEGEDHPFYPAFTAALCGHSPLDIAYADLPTAIDELLYLGDHHRRAMQSAPEDEKEAEGQAALACAKMAERLSRIYGAGEVEE